MSKHTPPTWAWVRGHGLMQMRDGLCVAPVLHATYEQSNGAGIVVSETHARLIEAAPMLLAALERAHQFITNGIELGYIRLPSPGTPDPALLTPEIVSAAIAAAKGNTP